jgi:hypothetical protein
MGLNALQPSFIHPVKGIQVSALVVGHRSSFGDESQRPVRTRTAPRVVPVWVIFLPLSMEGLRVIHKVFHTITIL